MAAAPDRLIYLYACFPLYLWLSGLGSKSVTAHSYTALYDLGSTTYKVQAEGSFT